MTACVCKGHTHAKRITVKGNDMGYLHTTQFFIQVSLIYTSSCIYIELMLNVPTNFILVCRHIDQLYGHALPEN